VDFLAKPVTPDVLRRVVAEVIERHAPAGPGPGPEADHPGHPAVVTLWPTVIDLSAVQLALNRREVDRAAAMLEPALDLAPGPGPGADHPGHPAVATLWPTVIALSAVKLALNRREFDRAAAMLERALDVAPDSAEALTLMGVLRESRGQDHAAYHAYRQALAANPGYGPARDNLRRYCARVGLDPDNPQINPAPRPGTPA